MDYVLHKSETRGHANHGWLDSHHTFSFAGYHDPTRMHFGLLRVLNDDVVKGGRGFSQHPHDNMEIVSIPLQGALEHRDNSGGQAIIKSGEVQIMSAGSGIEHSEKNASLSEDVNFLQLWVFPKELDITPRYEQRLFPVAERRNQVQTVISPQGDNNSLHINQDAWFHLASLEKGRSVNYTLRLAGNGLYVFVIEGSLTIANQQVGKRDGIGFWNVKEVGLTAGTDAELLLLDIPMN